MITSETSAVRKFLAIIEACQVDITLHLQSTWTNEEKDADKNTKALKIMPFLDYKKDLKINKDNKAEVIYVLSRYFNSSDFYHYEIKSGTETIGLGFDHCVINFLHPDYFEFTEKYLTIIDASEIVLTNKVGDSYKIVIPASNKN